MRARPRVYEHHLAAPPRATALVAAHSLTSARARVAVVTIAVVVAVAVATAVAVLPRLVGQLPPLLLSGAIDDRSDQHD